MNHSKKNSQHFDIFYFYPDPKGNGKEGYVLNDLDFKYNYFHDEPINYIENLDLFISFICKAVGVSMGYLVNFFDSQYDNFLLANTHKDIIFIPVSFSRFFTEKEKDILTKFHISNDLSLYGTNKNQALKTKADIKAILETNTINYIDNNHNSDLKVKEHNILFVEEGEKKFNNNHCSTLFYKENTNNNTIEVCLLIPEDGQQNEMDYIIYYGKKLYYIVLSQIDIETLKASLFYENNNFYYNYAEKLKENASNDTFTKLTIEKIEHLKNLYSKSI